MISDHGIYQYFFQSFCLQFHENWNEYSSVLGVDINAMSFTTSFSPDCPVAVDVYPVSLTAIHVDCFSSSRHLLVDEKHKPSLTSPASICNSKLQ